MIMLEQNDDEEEEEEIEEEKQEVEDWKPIPSPWINTATYPHKTCTQWR